MKIHDEEDRDEEARDDAPDLPGRDVLDAWMVPPVGAELTDRVLGHVETALSAEVVSMQERRRGGYGLALVGVAMVAAAALVLGLVQLWQTGPREPAPLVAAPVVVRVPVPVPAPRVVEPPVVAVEPVAPVDELVEESVEESVAPIVAPSVPEVEEPVEGKRSIKGSRNPKERLDPFASKAEPSRESSTEVATLRIGTASGYGPAKIFVDGKAKGTTPMVNIPVTPGRHTVKWVWSDGESDEAVVTLEAGQTQVLKGPTGQLKDPYR